MRHVIVLGARRSGTSLAASIIAQLGYFVENNSRPPDENNPEGYWESKQILNLNTRLLQRLGGTESEAPRAPDGWEMESRYDGERRKASLIVRSYETHSLWAMKDDRFSLTLPLWKLVLPDDISYMICIRNPLAVVKSISKMEPKHNWELSFRSWYMHLCGAILNTEGENRILIFYEDYRESPGSQIAKLCDFLGRKSTSEIMSRFRSDLSHQTPSLQEFLDSDRPPSQTKELYLSLLAVKSGSLSLEEFGRSLRDSFNTSSGQ